MEMGKDGGRSSDGSQKRRRGRMRAGRAVQEGRSMAGH